MTTPFPLGRRAEHDPRSASFAATATLPVTSKVWRRYGLVLDQGRLGSCTGNAAAHALNHAPLHVTGTTYHEPDAIRFYSEATLRDEWGDNTYPPTDEGSSGLGVSKAVLSEGLITGYQHAFDLDHALSALMAGPLIVGTDWYDDMFNPDAAGVVHPTGGVVGGHEYCLDGVAVASRMLRFQNSWSSLWGVGGRFYLSFADFSTLLAASGDAILFVR